MCWEGRRIEACIFRKCADMFWKKNSAWILRSVLSHEHHLELGPQGRFHCLRKNPTKSFFHGCNFTIRQWSWNHREATPSHHPEKTVAFPNNVDTIVGVTDVSSSSTVGTVRVFCGRCCDVRNQMNTHTHMSNVSKCNFENFLVSSKNAVDTDVPVLRAW